jgi:chromosome partitioning protein
MADARTILAQDIQNAIRDQYGDGITIFDPVVRRSVRFAESAVAGQSIIAYDPASPGAKAYQKIAKTILENRSYV